MLSAVPLKGGTFVAVDIETTGSRPGMHRVIEIGAVRIENGRQTGLLELLVDPGASVPAMISILTGITDADLVGAPDIADAMRRFREFAEGCVLVAHNHRFDLGFLDWEAQQVWGEPIWRPVLDTLALAGRLHPDTDRLNLRTLATHYGLDVVPNHRAGPDAIATAEVFLRMVPELEARGLSTAGEVAAFCGMPSQRILSDRLALTTDLPDAPGVYVFRDSAGKVLHVGRAKNLRVRVRNYFYSGSGHAGHPASARVARIATVATESELDALLLECRLISRHRPAYTKRVLRGDGGGCVIFVDTAVAFPSLVARKKLPRRGTSIGPFTSLGAARVLADEIARVYGLRRCSRRLSQALHRDCVFRGNGSCPQPCLDLVTRSDYAERVKRALATFTDPESFRAEVLGRQLTDGDGPNDGDSTVARDVLRALERCMSTLKTVQLACAPKGSVIIESGPTTIILHLIRHGYLRGTFRLKRADLKLSLLPERIDRLVRRVLPTDDVSCDPRTYSARQLREVFIIEAYRRQRVPLEIELSEDVADTTERICRAISRLAKAPRKSRAGA